MMIQIYTNFQMNKQKTSQFSNIKYKLEIQEMHSAY